MVSKIERRLHPRIPVNWPAVVRTPQDHSIKGEAKDISVGGVFIQCPEVPEIGENFQIILEPAEGQSILVTGEKVWAGNINIDGKTTYSGMGIHFTNLSAADREFISALVDKELEK